MRIVGGDWRGRRLAGPKGNGIRPTSDRLREALFNVLAHAYDDPVEGATVLDLFSGTGALAFEALSRGAAFALLVDDGREAGNLIRDNLAALDGRARARLIRRDATRLGPSADPPATLIFCDPPYGKGLAPAALTAAAKGGWLAVSALVLVEEVASAGPVLPEGSFRELERRSYGETAVTFARFEG
ncbi:16S rRNA (guanine966-N2)-methyltransferase [Methylorubrum rhodinum]|uniref:16S rRNA (Guanine966-N2)-methyltransferase n=1 Tax=Methylorubrum rhodinum TaxID=29428 RepID=A0A840ZRQ3_9HYPH|nr:16S rRNA (guanine(966)-N(2))-methyltransferase RsmD [Methylorubrum rhodinum]MBB5759541.1 16S rRNA (guanine966-N2)-methyltransferase [Methylorubrum rhodinum]